MVSGQFVKRKIEFFRVSGRLAVIPLIILASMSLLMIVHLHYRSPDFPYSSDSAYYIEQARSLADSGSALVTPWGLSPSNPDRIKDTLFPIGFPIILATISKFGIDAKDAAVATGHLSAMLLPWLLYFCFRNALGSCKALVLAGISLISPSVLTNSPMGLTDIFTLALAVGAISLTLNSRSTLGFIIGGILAGISYAVRNAQLALLITIVLYFCYLWVTSDNTERRAIYKNTASQFLGISIIVFPVLIRNLYLFDSLNPYQMAPSTIDFFENLRTHTEAFIQDITACYICADYLTSPLGLLMLTLLAICYCWAFIKYTWSNLKSTAKKAIAISVSYILISSCIVIAARTRYQWGEPINIRHTLQYSPFLLTILLAPIGLYSNSIFAKWLQKLCLVLVFVLTCFHINYVLFSTVLQDLNWRQPFIFKAYNTGKKHLCLNENNIFLVSNWGYLFRIKCESYVRHSMPFNIIRNTTQSNMPVNDGYNGLMAAITDIKIHSQGREIHAGFFPGRYGLEAEDFPLPITDHQKLLDSGWEVIRNDEHGLLIQYPRGKN